MLGYFGTLQIEGEIVNETLSQITVYGKIVKEKTLEIEMQVLPFEYSEEGQTLRYSYDGEDYFYRISVEVIKPPFSVPYYTVVMRNEAGEEIFQVSNQILHYESKSVTLPEYISLLDEFYASFPLEVSLENDGGSGFYSKKAI